jgi:ubiquinone/menaquinone biosynthesis C-methylase UbiE
MSHSSSSLEDEHKRYLVQAEWTEELRLKILQRIGLRKHVAILEIGSGTGAITQSIKRHVEGNIFGVDIDFASTLFASKQSADIHYAQADGYLLPFADDVFDTAIFHFLLMWMEDPAGALFEIARTVKPGGWVIAFAEPDYGGRIDYPPFLEEIGLHQTSALERAGADPMIGRTLRAMFSKAHLRSITSGVLGGEWHSKLEKRLTRSEWDTLKADLEDHLSKDRLQQLESADRDAWADQTRVLFVPTFYAYGQVP